MKYTPTIGLEIHIELKTNTKMFCSCKNDPDEKEPNRNVCPVCLAHPGTLPVINEEAVKKVLKTGLALNCQIPEFSQFDRKNYFYPDLPKGYQISQYKYPLCGSGYLEIENLDSRPASVETTADKPADIKSTDPQLETRKHADLNSKRIRITRIHLEEDTGKLMHPEGKNYSLVDFNRAGVPLMELVSEPDIESGKEAKNFCEELQLILRYLEVSSADMEKGEMRCEVNISLMRMDANKDANERKLGTKVEIKNLNSFKSVEKSIDYEIKRQSRLLDEGKKIVQETRGWDENKEVTLSQRTKEEAHDYRYFPEPDLPPLEISKEMPDDLDKLKGDKIYLCDIQKTMPELPQQKRQRFNEEYSLPKEQIEILVKNKDLGEYFEKVASELREWVKSEETKHIVSPDCKKLYKLAANYLITELQKLTRQSEKEAKIEKISGENFAELIKMISKGEINSSAAQEILKIMYQKGGDPSDIAQSEKLLQMSDLSGLEAVIDKVMSENPKVVADYKKGKANALQYLIGQIMKKTRGQANPQVAQEILYKKLMK